MANTADSQAILTDTKPITPISPTKTPSTDPLRFHSGVILKGKIIGLEDVKEESGDKICNEAMIKLKALVAAKKEHKQQIFIKISLEGVQLIDAKTNEIIHHHPVKTISYISRDPTDARAFGYIFTMDRKNFQYLAIKTEKNSIETILQLRDLFEVVYDMEKMKESSKVEESTTTSQPATASTTAEVPQTQQPQKQEVAPQQLEQQQQQMATQQAPQQSSIFDLDSTTTSTSQSTPSRQQSIFDSTNAQVSSPATSTLGLDFFDTQSKPVQLNTQVSTTNSDLFSLSVSPELFTPPDKFSELKKSLGTLSAQSQVPQQHHQQSQPFGSTFPGQMPQQQVMFNATMQPRQPPVIPPIQTAYGTPNPFGTNVFSLSQQQQQPQQMQMRPPFGQQQQQQQMFGMPQFSQQPMMHPPQAQQQKQQQQQSSANSFPW